METEDSDSDGFSPSYVVHPTTLDGLAQLILLTLAQTHTSLPPMVPVHASSIWIDCGEHTVRQGTSSVVTRCHVRGQRGASADIAAMAIGSAGPLIYLNGLETSFIRSTGSSDAQDLRCATFAQDYLQA